MFWIIVRRELFEHITRFRFSAVFILTVLLMVSSVLVSSLDFQKELSRYRRWPGWLVGEDGKTNLTMIPCGASGLHAAPTSLSFCSGSADRELPNQAVIAPHALQEIDRTTDVAQILDPTDHLDWSFVVSVILSFAAGLLTYKTIAGELRDGTLTIVLSNPVSRATLLLAKYVAAMLALTIPLIAGMALSLFTVQMTAAIPLSGDDWLKIGFFTLSSLLCLSVFSLIGLLSSVVARSPVLSAVAFMFSWTILVFVIPNLGGVAAELLGSSKTPMQMHGLALTIQDKYPLQPNRTALEYASLRLQREEASERLLMEYTGMLEQQVNFGRFVTRVSPAATYSYAVENITGVGMPRFKFFLNNVIRYREGYFKAILEADKSDPNSEHRYEPWTCGSSNFSKLTVDLGPAKEFRDLPPSSAVGLEAAMGDLALLAFYNLFVFAIAFRRFVRQEVAPTPGT